MNTEKYTPAQESKYVAQLQSLIKEHRTSYHNVLKSKEFLDLLDYIRYKTPLLNDEFYSISTRIYWVLNDLTDFPSCHCCGKPFIKRNVCVLDGYPKFCSAMCRNKSPEFIEARKASLIRKYGSIEAYNLYNSIGEKTDSSSVGRMNRLNFS